MAVVIRLRRTGRTNLPCFRITVTDSRFPRDGRSLETIGLYDPLKKDRTQAVKVDAERVTHWMQHGAKPSDIVASIFRRHGIPMPTKTKVVRERKRDGKTATAKRRTGAKDARLAAKAARASARKAAKKAAAPAAEQA
jgi:small subunit ribosomal protein S16